MIYYCGHFLLVPEGFEETPYLAVSGLVMVAFDWLVVSIVPVAAGAYPVPFYTLFAPAAVYMMFSLWDAYQFLAWTRGEQVRGVLIVGRRLGPKTASGNSVSTLDKVRRVLVSRLCGPG
jgi:hypothetical protein